MRTKSVAILASALALGVLAVTAEAQQHKATRLGNPATRFAKPLKKGDELRVLLRSDKMKADVAAILNEAGWKGNHEDLDRAAATAEITGVQIAPGTRLPFMASRKNKKPHALMDVLWAGQKPIDAFAFEFSSNCVRYRLVTPEACSNFWIEDLGKDTADPKCAAAAAPAASRLRERREREPRVTQPVEYAVERAEPAGRRQGHACIVNGKETRDRQAHERTPSRFTFAGAPTPGTYEVKAVSGGVTGTTTRAGQALPADLQHHRHSRSRPRSGKPFTVDLSGSRVAAGVKGGIKSAKVEVVDREGRRRRHLRDGRRGLGRSDVVDQEGRHPHRPGGGDRRGRPGLHERLRSAGRRQGRVPDLRRAATSARNA